MKIIWEEGWAETNDGRDTKGRVLTIELGRFVFSMWLTKAEK